jgi:TRAP-type mannitol/chloroaromatic compound transport system permease large subunit
MAFFPGLLLGALYIAYALIRPALQPHVAPVPTTCRRSVGTCLWRIPKAALILGVLGSNFAGLATPTEASGVGAVGALLLALLSGRLRFGVLSESLYQTSRTSAFIFAIFLGVTAFSVVLRGSATII